MNHKALVDDMKASLDGEDLRVFYRPNETSLPHEIDRVVTGLYTKEANVQFKIQEMIPGDTVEGSSYALVFGGKKVGKAKADPRKVFAFFEDFSSPSLNKWIQVWGEWSVKSGVVFGKTGKSSSGLGEVGLYLKEGGNWRDVEVELDLQETGSGVVYPGPFLRIQKYSLSHTTAWWFEYWTDHKECTMRPFVNNKDGVWKYKCQLPEKLVKNKWFHFRYRVLGTRIMQWANEALIQNATVGSDWMVPKGSIGLGCHTSNTGCRTFYDNIKVRVSSHLLTYGVTSVQNRQL